jgi:hypothetical protein
MMYLGSTAGDDCDPGKRRNTTIGFAATIAVLSGISRAGAQRGPTPLERNSVAGRSFEAMLEVTRHKANAREEVPMTASTIFPNKPGGVFAFSFRLK